MSKPLGALLAGLDAELRGDAATPISEVCYDSREAGPGTLFVALRGASDDGHRFAADAVTRGSAALLVEEWPGPAPPVAVARVTDTRSALARVAAELFDHPGRDLRLIGVTGTNGKTSTVRLLESILTASGRRAGSVGTISVRWPDAEESTGLTTPESADLQRTLARMRDADVDSVALEVSSHSLAQGRLGSLRFAAATFTNLTQDHLDYHRTMEEYARSKALLFAEYTDGPAVLNVADPSVHTMARAARSAGLPIVGFARAEHDGWAEATVRTLREDVRLEGSSLRIDCAGTPLDVQLELPGDFQVENALAAVATAFALEIPAEAIVRGVASCGPVPGRLERVGACRPVVLVDYAHTPDALDRLLGRVRPFVSGRLIAVFGCGGDRDTSKRAPMARAACAHADHVIATSDNPRTEDPGAILDDVAVGLSGSHEVVVDRRAAIARAIELAGSDDVVVIAGKGHEDYQIVGRERRPFDDRVEAGRALAARRAAAAEGPRGGVA